MDLQIPSGVTTIGEYAFSGCNSINSVTFSNTVTSIEKGAFQNCESIKSIHISDSVVNIGEFVFDGCALIESIEVDTDNSIYHSYENCLIETLSGTLIKGCNNSIIPSDGSVSIIGKYAFRRDNSIIEIVIPENITTIEDYAFSYCENLISVTIPSSVTNISLNSFNNSDKITFYVYQYSYASKFIANNFENYVIIPSELSGTCGDDLTFVLKSDGTLEISGSGELVYNWNDLKEYITTLRINEGLTSITDKAFADCVNLNFIELPNTLISIGDSAFDNTAYYNNAENWIDNVLYINNCLIEAKSTISGKYDILEGTKCIARGVFDNCENLIITIPDSVTSITNGSFVSNALDDIIVNEGNTVYHSENNCLIETKSKKLIVAGKNSIIPDDGSVTSIGLSSFAGNENLISINIPGSVTSIESNAFLNCANLKSVTLSEGLETIGNAAFAYCKNLNSVIIPSSVNSIKTRVFMGCNNLILSVYENSYAHQYATDNNISYVLLDVCDLGHNLIQVEEKQPTQTEVGWNAYEYCTNCDYTTYTEIPKLHTYNEGWQQSNGRWWYQYSDGSYAIDFAEIKGQIYYFDSNGWMQIGWQKIGSTWYYFSSSGAMQTNWKKIGGVWYYFDGAGRMRTGWMKISNVWYYFDTSGAMQTGWEKISNVWYYFNKSGAMLTGWQKIGGVWYYFKSSGTMATGWVKDGATWYYMASSGAMQTGWIKQGTTWYYLDSSGAMLAGTSKTIGGKTYTFNASGVCTNP